MLWRSVRVMLELRHINDVSDRAKEAFFLKYLSKKGPMPNY